ncbi:putative secreted protein (Por secretion system target) [Chitinophaga japonensis]|uniref:Putative secreted protein (Por secretion system target) n=2 Tax=Chitinophaga japonensis TaxID=104662 RepID=A0A562TFM3_CHIJA|nr:putative secreted protein (Por secretion system target) [Chitinophaga japonensis]
MGRTTNGALAGQWNSSSSYNQQWQQVASGNYVKLRNRATGLYLDGLGQAGNGADLGQWGESSSSNQQWIITPVGQPRRANVVDMPLTRQMPEPENDRVLLYPNPFTSTFRMIVDKPEEVERVIIFDIAGKQVEAIESPSASNLLSMGASLKPGTYIVRVEGISWLETGKIIKVN